MHRCLEVYDIVLVVVEFLNFLDHAHPNEPCNLLSFGLSCRHLFDPAMDILWSTQEDLYNLVKCMPSDLWQVTTSNDSEGNLRSMMVSTLVPISEYRNGCRSQPNSPSFDHHTFGTGKGLKSTQKGYNIYVASLPSSGNCHLKLWKHLFSSPMPSLPCRAITLPFFQNFNLSSGLGEMTKTNSRPRLAPYSVAPTSFDSPSLLNAQKRIHTRHKVSNAPY